MICPKCGQELLGKRCQQCGFDIEIDTFAACLPDRDSFAKAFNSFFQKETVLELSDRTMLGVSFAIQNLIHIPNTIPLETVRKYVQEVRSAYSALSTREKDLIIHISDLEKVENALKKDVYPSEIYAARSVSDDIWSATLELRLFDDITPHAVADIREVRRAYDALSESVKKYVWNYKELCLAEYAVNNNLKPSAVISADAVITSINSSCYPTNHLTDFQAREIHSARIAFDALSAEGKKLVNNYDMLLEAEKRIISKK